MRAPKVLLIVAAVAGSAFSQTLPQGVEKKASVGGITEYDYPNGLRVLLFPDPSSPKVTVNMTYLVGSRFEGYGETGMAHLLEHMNFIQTTNGRSVKKELTDHGAQWNGTTDYDRTNYFETVTASDDNLKWALSLEADRMVNMRVEKQLLDTEMTVVRNEFERGENNPQSILEERVIARLRVPQFVSRAYCSNRDPGRSRIRCPGRGSRRPGRSYEPTGNLVRAESFTCVYRVIEQVPHYPCQICRTD